jgi:hypothetical protein
MTPIRMADERDEIEIFRLCEMMWREEHPRKRHPLSWSKVSPMIRMATRRERGIIGVIGEPGDLKAAVFLLIEPVWFSDTWILCEYFNYVRPDARRSTYAKDLIAFSKSCADALRLDLSIGVLSNSRTEAKVRLYKRMLPYAGAFFYYQQEDATPTAVDHGALMSAVPANSVAAE